MLRTLFIRRKVESSGYMVSEDSILLIPSYVEKVLEWPLLRSGLVKNCLSILKLKYCENSVSEF